MREFIEFQPFLPNLVPNFEILKGTKIDPDGKCFENHTDKLMETSQNLPVDIHKIMNNFLIMKVYSIKTESNSGSLFPIRNIPKEYPEYSYVNTYYDSDTENRFTMAHEAGHVIFESYRKQVTTNIEDLADSLARRILAPKKLVIDEFQKIKDKDTLLKFSILYDKFQIPAYELAKRMVDDLKLINENLIIWSLNKPEQYTENFFDKKTYPEGEEEWLISNDKDINMELMRGQQVNKEKRHKRILYDNRHDGFIKNKELINVPKYALTKKENEKLFSLWNIETKGITLGSEKEKIIVPEYVVFSIRKLSKIAQVEDPDFLNPNLVSETLNFFI